MNKNFEDKGLAIQYLQTVLKQTYNTDVFVNSEYYKTFDMNYGFAHYIAKYLDYAYPLLDRMAIHEYNNIELIGNTPNTEERSLYKPISIMNYFLASNNGEKLVYNYISGSESPIYDDIYNRYMRVWSAPSAQTGTDVWKWREEYLKTNDLPLFTFSDGVGYIVRNNVIFNLQKWDTPKNICEIDDFVASYLLGMVIGPNSSMEDIYYAQKLLIQNREIEEDEKGVWCASGNEGTYKDMTQTVINYQKQRVIPNSSSTLFVTGYFDVRTESQILKDIGDVSYGILGL